MDRDQFAYNLQTISDVFGVEEVKPFLLGGLVLRSQRLYAGDRLDYDDDVDFGIPHHAWGRISPIVRGLRARGATNHRMWFNNAGDLTGLSVMLNGTKVDFFCHYLDHLLGMVSWYAYTADTQLLRQMPIFWLSHLTILEQKFLAPFPVLDYMVHQYGKDWETPNPNYMYWEDCPCNISKVCWTGHNFWDESLISGAKTL